jgi:DNA-directed RNA polymerase subunit RPC12/RpoP
MEFIIFVWVASLFVSIVIGAKKGNPVGGGFLGLVLGPLGAIIVLLSRDKNRVACPYCAEKIMKAAIICPHCHKELSQTKDAQGYQGT